MDLGPRPAFCLDLPNLFSVGALDRFPDLPVDVPSVVKVDDADTLYERFLKPRHARAIFRILMCDRTSLPPIFFQWSRDNFFRLDQNPIRLDVRRLGFRLSANI